MTYITWPECHRTAYISECVVADFAAHFPTQSWSWIRSHLSWAERRRRDARREKFTHENRTLPTIHLTLVEIKWYKARSKRKCLRFWFYRPQENKRNLDSGEVSSSAGRRHSSQVAKSVIWFALRKGVCVIIGIIAIVIIGIFIIVIIWNSNLIIIVIM